MVLLVSSGSSGTSPVSFPGPSGNKSLVDTADVAGSVSSVRSLIKLLVEEKRPMTRRKAKIHTEIIINFFIKIPSKKAPIKGPKTVEIVGKEAFSGCTKLDTIVVHNDANLTMENGVFTLMLKKAYSGRWGYEGTYQEDAGVYSITITNMEGGKSFKLVNKY